MTLTDCNRSGVPKGWVAPSLGELLEFQYGKGLTQGRRDAGAFPVYGSNGIVGHHSEALTAGPCLVVGRKGAAGAVHVTKERCWPIDTTYFVEPPDGVDLTYCYYYLGSLPLASLDRSTAIPGLNRDDAYALPFLLPPLAEQQRIVGKIEELLTRLEAGVEALKAAQRRLKAYRQAVLRDAFTGKLTAEWRERQLQDPNSPLRKEPASALLARIHQERGEAGAQVTGRKRLPRLDNTDLPELPDGWVWTTIHALAEPNPTAVKAGPFGSSLKKECYVARGYKIYGQEQVIRGDPFYGDYYIDEQRYEALKSCAVKPGDVLVSLVGTIGKVLVLPEGIEPGIINPRLVKLSLDGRYVSGRFIKAYIESSSARDYFSLASHGGTMDILNLAILRRLPIPLPHVTEQTAILNEAERLFSVAESVERTIERSLKEAERLRQSILKRAFEGKLVPQDPSDEPAEKLLERIKAEKARVEAAGAASKRKRARVKPNR